MRGIAAVLAAALLLPGAAAAQDGKTAEERTAEFAKLPDWTGLWLTEFDETTIGGLGERALEAKENGGASAPQVMRLNGFGAPWNAEGQRRQAERARVGGNRKADGWGYPMMMNAAAPIQFLITPEEVLVINAYRDVRHIRTDGKGHPAPDDLWPTVWGDSIGHWEGDTLVVDTIAVTNPNVYFHGGPPLSDDARYVERIRMTEPGKIVDEITIEDPATLTGPWKATLSFVPAQGFDRMVHEAYTNDRTVVDGDNSTIAPPADQQ